MLIFDKPDLISSLTSVLEESLNSNPGLNYLSLASRDGLPMLSTSGKTTLPEETLAVVNATSIFHGQMILNELNKGNIKELVIKAEKGLLILFPVGKDVSLLGMCEEKTDLRILLINVKRSAKVIQKYLNES